MTTRDRMTLMLLLLAVAVPAAFPPTPGSSPGQALAATGMTATNEGEFLTHPSNAPLFGTPIVTAPDGAIVICYIDPALNTVVRRKDPQTGWSAATVVGPKTRNDPWHNQCSLGLDTAGYVHVAYNMHSTPWQYSRSMQPHSVAAWQFLGQDAGANPGGSTTADSQCTGQCATDWITDEPGIAALPGNQITYPHFATGADGTLYVAYRECFDCGSSSYHARQWSGGIARYDVQARTWSRLGGVRPWATDPAQLAVALRIVGDAGGRLHAAWLWCPHYTQAEGGEACFAHPNHLSYAMSDDRGTTWRTSPGAPLPLPLRPGATEVVVGPEWFDSVQAPGYFAGNVKITSLTAHDPVVTIFPHLTTADMGRVRSYVRIRSGAWTAPAKTDYAPSLFYGAGGGVLHAVSSGVRLHTSTDEGASWTLEELDVARGPFTFAHDATLLRTTNRLRLYANNAPAGLLVIWTVQFPAPAAPAGPAARCYATLVKVEGEQVGSVLKEEPCP